LLKDQAAAEEGRVAHVSASDGLQLAIRSFDAPASPRLPLLCLAGLSRNSRDFIPLGRFFASHPTEPRTVMALDSRGRGLSESSPDWRTYTPAVEAADVLAAAAALRLDRVLIVGTSRGGILAMLLAGLRPDLLAGVVLNDIGPVIERAGLERIRGYLAARRPLQTFPEAVSAVRAAIGLHFPALSDADWSAYAAATFRAGPSGFEPDFDPALINLVQDPDFAEYAPVLWPQFAALSAAPVLATRGENSDLLSRDTLAEMGERHPDLEAYTVPGQGHAPLLSDAPTLERILQFARRCDPARR